MTSCGTVPVILHASTIVTTTTYGSTARYICNHGYTLQGSAMLECLASGSWYPAEEVQCVLVDCGKPPLVPNSRRYFNATGADATARYVCLEGYAMTGGDVIECGEDGRWGGQVPSCRPKRYLCMITQYYQFYISFILEALCTMQFQLIIWI